MKSYVRYRRDPLRRYPAARYRLISPKIGYLYRADGKILTFPFSIADEACRDGAMLRVPPVSFADIYYSKILPVLRCDTEQEAAAVYFDPFAGQFLVVGSRQLYQDARAQIGTAGKPTFLEHETPFRFDPMTYGTLVDPDEMTLTFDDYFLPDVTGTTIADCMVLSEWDERPAPWHCAIDFVSHYSEKLLTGTQMPGPDPLTTLLAAIVREGNHLLLSRLFTLMPQLLLRFSPTLQQEEKFRSIRLPGVEDSIHPTVFNLFQYAMLCADRGIIETLFCFYEHPRQLLEFLRHPMYYHLGFHHIRQGNDDAIALLLSKNYYPDASEGKTSRVPLLSYACQHKRPAVTAMLLEAGANPSKCDGRGVTPFFYASDAEDCTSLVMLLSATDKLNAREIAVSLAEKLPLSDDNQAMLSILKMFL